MKKQLSIPRKKITRAQTQISLLSQQPGLQNANQNAFNNQRDAPLISEDRESGDQHSQKQLSEYGHLVKMRIQNFYTPSSLTLQMQEQLAHQLQIIEQFQSGQPLLEDRDLYDVKAQPTKKDEYIDYIQFQDGENAVFKINKSQTSSFKFKSLLHNSNRNPSVFNTEIIYENRLKIVYAEQNSTQNFLSDQLYLTLYADQDLDISIRLKFPKNFYGNGELDDLAEGDEAKNAAARQRQLAEQLQLQGEQKVQQFLQQKTHREKTSEELLDDKTLRDMVSEIWQRRRRQQLAISAQDHRRENKRVTKYRPELQEQSRYLRKVASEEKFMHTISVKKNLDEQQRKEIETKIMEREKKIEERLARNHSTSNMLCSRAAPSKLGRPMTAIAANYAPANGVAYRRPQTAQERKTQQLMRRLEQRLKSEVSQNQKTEQI